MMTERRRISRQRVLRRASIVFNGRQSVFDCAIRNWSDSGAMVRLSDWTALPPTFELDVASGGGSVRVRQCWRRGDDVGVAFMSPEECRPPPPVDLAMARLRRAATG
jgi:hypothetical protein